MCAALSLENPLFKTYLYYSSILILKMLLMTGMTSMQRFKNKAFANPEDAAFMKVKTKTNEDVERVRRAHLNDVENIPIFMMASFAYIFTNPPLFLATWLFRAFVFGRIAHSFVYAVVVVPQPARGIAFTIGMLPTIYMAVKTAMHFY